MTRLCLVSGSFDSIFTPSLYLVQYTFNFVILSNIFNFFSHVLSLLEDYANFSLVECCGWHAGQGLVRSCSLAIQ